MTTNPKLLLRTILRALLLAVPVLLAMTVGCGKKHEQIDSEGRRVIHFWQFWTDPRVKTVVVNAVEEFEKENPLYKVEITDLTWDNGYQKLVAAFAAGEVPDLVELGSDWIAEFADRGALLQLDQECEKMKDKYVGWPPAIWDSNCYALPWYVATRVFFQNDDLAALIMGHTRPHPITWARLLEYAKDSRLSRPKAWGFGVNAAEPHRLYKRFLPFLWAAGGDVLTEDQTACAMETEAGRQALQFIVNLSEGQYVEKQAALDDAFIQGKLLFHFSGDWLYEKLKSSGTSTKYSAFPMPYPAPGQGTQAGFAGGEYLAIPRKAAEPVAAINLARTLLSAKNIFNLCIATGAATPANMEVASNSYFFDDSVRDVFIYQLNEAHSPPAHPRWLEMEDVIEKGVEKALYEKARVEDVLHEMCEGINKILADYEKEKKK
jgi:multiple sugar transport system substrate-binding protein